LSSQSFHELIHDWSQDGPHAYPVTGHVMLDDESLRDGLQSPSVLDPSVDTKVRILHLMDALGIETVDLGLPGAGPRQFDAVLTLAREIVREKLSIEANCAGRTMVVDIEPMARVSQLAGLPIEACLFIGSSPIRIFAEDWEMEKMLGHIRDSVSFAAKEKLPVMFVTEDTVRSSPEHLASLFGEAIEAGASRLCLCDTCGAGTPEGVFNLVSWVRGWLKSQGAEHIGLDWHGHRDRGLAVANSLAAIAAGVTRVHATALGVGERVGNTAMEQLLVNLKLLGLRDDDLSQLPVYVKLVAQAVGLPVPVNAPVVGRDAFRTATGVHASAVAKAMAKGDVLLADAVYSGVPAHWVGRQQEIEIGHMSGASNVHYYLGRRGIESSPQLVANILAEAKKLPHLLSEEEILRIVSRTRRLADEQAVE